MRSLQQEFIEISSNLKASLKQRMKFEIAERIISDSRSFMYFRLFMIQQYEHRYNSLKQFNPESPTLFKLTPLECANEYKTLIFSLINNLNIDHHTPGDKVISQNEDVLNEEEEFLGFVTHDHKKHSAQILVLLRDKSLPDYTLVVKKYEYKNPFWMRILSDICHKKLLFLNVS